MRKHLITLLCVAGMVVSGSVLAETLKIRPDAPARYVVKKGDTLWGISGKYLYRPWKWPALWNANKEQIANPHLIYPGQVLVLNYINGHPTLNVEGVPTIKLSPHVRDNGSGYGINAINADFYTMFMKHNQFISTEELRTAARLLGGPDNKILYNVGDRVYADGITQDGDYLIFRSVKDLKDPLSKRNLGYMIEYVGEASTLSTADKSLAHRVNELESSLSSGEYVAKVDNREIRVRHAQPMFVTSIVSEITRGDYLVAKPKDLNSFQMMPHEPQVEIDANIVELIGGISEGAMTQTIIINKGKKDGLDKGAVLGIYKRGQIIKSSKRQDNSTMYANTPVQEVGLAMVYRVGDDVSSAIILESTTNINKDDLVSNPGRDLDSFGASQIKK